MEIIKFKDWFEMDLSKLGFTTPIKEKKDSVSSDTSSPGSVGKKRKISHGIPKTPIKKIRVGESMV